MDDWEIKNSIDRNTWDQSRQASELGKMRRDQERFHREILDEQQEREMREKISRLELALAQTSDSKQRQGVKNLLDEAILEQNAYYLEKAELERQERRRQIIYNIFLGLILIILAFVAFFFWNSYQNKKEQANQLQTSSTSLIQSQDASNQTDTASKSDTTTEDNSPSYDGRNLAR